MIDGKGVEHLPEPKHNIEGAIGFVVFGLLVFGGLFGMPEILWWVVLASVGGYVVACTVK
jgi:hypothetical protein